MALVRGPLGWAMVHSFQDNPNLVSGKALCRCGQRLPSQFILAKVKQMTLDAVWRGHLIHAGGSQYINWGFLRKKKSILQECSLSFA